MSANKGELVVLLEEVLPPVPTHRLRAGLHDPRRALRFAVGELSAGIARGRVEVRLSQFARICPEVFEAPTAGEDDPAIRLPLQKLLQQLARVAPLAAAEPAPLSEQISEPPAPANTPRGEESSASADAPEAPPAAAAFAETPEASAEAVEEAPVPHPSAAENIPASAELADSQPAPSSPKETPALPELLPEEPAPDRASAQSVDEPDVSSVAETTPLANDHAASEANSDADAANHLPAPLPPPPAPAREIARAALRIPCHVAMVRPPLVHAERQSPPQPATLDAADFHGSPGPVREVAAASTSRPPLKLPPLFGNGKPAPPLLSLPAGRSAPAALPEASAQTGSEGWPALDQGALQTLFHTEEALDLPEICRLAAGLPGVHGCFLLAEGATLRGGVWPAELDPETLRELCGRLAAAVAAFPEKLPGVQAVTLHTGAMALSIFARASVCVCIAHAARGFLPGVREKLAVLADKLSAGFAGLAK